MKKEIRRFPIKYYCDWTWGITIEELEKDLAELKKLGVTHIDIEPTDDYGSPSINIEFISERLETDKECYEREKEAKEKEEYLKLQDLKKFNEIKSKYNL